MKEKTLKFIDEFFARHGELLPLREEIVSAGSVLRDTFARGGKLLLCGNGGSCADCDHIAGELLKGFMLRRPVTEEFDRNMSARFADEGHMIASRLQQGLPAISLAGHAAAISAFANDVDPELVYAQQVLAYGRGGDVLIGISTSGNAKNVACAVMTAAAKGLTCIGLTGRDGGRLAKLCDIALIMPETETYRIQEQHIAVYHLLCTVVEYELFDE